MLQPHKAAVKAWAQRMYELNAYVLDTETTGFGVNDVVLEIAVARLETKRLIFSAVYNPAGIPHEVFLEESNAVKASHIHGLTVADICSGLSYPMIEQFLSSLRGRTIVAYNAPFDRRLIQQSYPDVFQPVAAPLTEPQWEFEQIYQPQWECAMQASIHGFPELISKKTGRVRLEQMCQHFGIKPGEHFAYSDVMATCQLIEAFANLS